MRLLLDTHILLWFFQNHASLKDETRDIILSEDNSVYFSVVSAWEVSVKHTARPDKMFLNAARFLSLCVESGFEMLPLIDKHILSLDTLQRAEGAPPHKDPFDKMLIAQAKSEDMVFLTHDGMLPYYNEACVRLV